MTAVRKTATRCAVTGLTFSSHMGVVYEVVKKLNGKMDPDKAMNIIKGMKIDSPRGPIQIDPVTRDVVQTVYVRKVEKKDGKLYNIEFDKFDNVRDPGT